MKRTCCFVLSALAVACGSPTPDSSVREGTDQSEGPILNGVPLYPKVPVQYIGETWLVGNNGTHCSGTAITNQWVLTAAHCLDVRSRFDPPSLTVYLGGRVENFTSNTDFVPEIQMRTAKQVIQHPDLDTNVPTKNDAYGRYLDVGLVRVDPMPIGDAGATTGHHVALFDGKIEDHLGEYCDVYAYGKRNINQPTYEGVLRYASLPIYGISANSQGQRPGSTFITGAGRNPDGAPTGALNGDSGGPCFLNEEFAGVLASTTDYTGDPTLINTNFTRPEVFRNWVRTTMFNLHSAARPARFSDFGGFDESSEVRYA